MECRLDKSFTVSGGNDDNNNKVELVKYMSKLPVFLERTETTPTQENHLLSVGVLHWSRLEKWHHTHHNNRIVMPSVTDESSSAGPSNVHHTTSSFPRKHRSSRQSTLLSNPREEIKRTRKKKPKDHRGFSVPSEKLGLNTDEAQAECEKKGLKAGALSNGLNPEVSVNMEVTSRADTSRRKRSEKKKLRERVRDGPDGEVGQKQRGETKLYHSTNKLSQEETNNSCGRSSTKKVQVVHSVVEGQHSCSLPCKADGCSPKSKLSQCVPLSTKETNTSSGGNKLSEDRASSLLSVKKHCTDEPPQRQDSKSHIAVSEKGRSTSPFQWRSFSMGKASKTNGAGSTTTKLDSVENSSKTVSSVSEKDTTTTSHLRRFLEPLLKQRATHSGDSVDGPRGEGVPRIKLGITGCRSVNVNDSAHEKKVGSSMVRAVLQVTVKNNQPLFRFAVNKETDIIAATQKKMGSSEEGECISVYTFFSIKDHKRNSSWLNQRGRGQTHGLISNVVAQMRVSSSLLSGSIREFVLFSVELDQESAEKSDLQLKNELAAIIVKMPRWFSTVQDHNAIDKEVKDHIKDRVFEQDISATVILQSGVHSMPHKGGPSSLIQRWRTGGSCDCGGWDMGCNLRILTNQHNFSCKNSTASSNSPSSSNPFELFFLGEEAEEHPFLSYKPIKEGIYSVVYDSSLSQLQAFSICMALAESRKMSELTLEHKSSRDQHKARAETLLVPGPRFKA
ncbi:hypothetical protein Rs2_05691 [Raphanus sativus]|nr:hypothetical protein Rs2_05691 [Raphanus sativus]